MHQHGYIQHVNTTTDIDISQHDQTLAEFKTRFLSQVRSPVRPQYLL